MAKINIPPIRGGFNLSKINSAIETIEDHLNSKVLYRDNPEGEPNHMLNDLDMDGNRIYNLPSPTEEHEVATKEYVDKVATVLPVESFIRTNPDEVLNELPEAVDRAGKVLTFDANGQPTVQYPASDSATQLRMDLQEYVGTLGGFPEWSDIPAHVDPSFDVQTQALANRTEHLQNTKLTAIDLKDAGAETGVDCGELLLSLFDSNLPILVPFGSFVATLNSEADVIKFWANINKISTEGNLVVTLPSGKQSIPSAANITSNLQGLSIKGREPIALSVASVVDVVSDVFTAYDGFGVLQTDWRYHRVTYSLADASSVSVGDYVHIPWVSGDNTETSGVLSHLGIHEVIAKSGNNITVLISSHYTPSTAFTAIEMQKIPTVLSFATSANFGAPAIVATNGGILGGKTSADLGGLSDVVFVGKGCVLTMPDGRSPAAFDAFGQGGHTGVTARDNGRIAFGRNVGFSGWPAGSVAASRNSDISSSYPATSSMSGRNGFVASSSTMEIQNIIIGGRNYGTIATGSLNDGFENQDNAFMYCDNSLAVGNHRTGYSSTGNSYGNFSVGTAVGNKFDGVVSEASAILFKPGYCAFNGSNGLLAQNKGHINAAGSEVTKNGGNGVMATQSSQIQFGGGKSSYNTGSDYLSNTGGQIHAVFSPIPGYTPTSSPNFNVIGPSGSAVWSITNPTSIAIGVSSPAVVFDSSNSALFGTNGSGFPASRIKIGGNAAAAGGYFPSADQTYNLNASAYRFNNSYFVNAPTVTSDAREKTEPQNIDDALLDAWGEVGIFAWQWLKSVQEKGEEARIHYGPIAQHIRDVLVRHGYMQEGSTNCRHAPLCYDEWSDEYEPIMATRINDAGEVEEYGTGEKRLILAAGDRWGIRADQCLFLEAAYQRRRADRIEQRLAVLEANLTA